jgi:4-amino-4-deoxy-L-arabinose transferase-like glycosyltransferase
LNAARLRALSQGPLFMLAAFVWLSASNWIRPLAMPDEGRYVGVGWEMLRSGDWLVPTLNGMPYFHKPPLFYWISAASMSIFGANEWAARLAPALAATCAAWALFLFVRRWVDARSGRAVVLVLLTTPLFFAGAQFANHDQLVATWIAVAVLAAAHAVLACEAGQPYRGALLVAFAAAALGVLSKGLIGAVLPALVVIVWALASGRPRALLFIVWVPGLALFLLIAAPWFVAMQMRYPGFFDYFFVHQHFQRFTRSSGFNNPQPAWFFVQVLALLTLPWFVWIYRACRRSYVIDPARRDVRILMWVWLLVVLVFFSLPTSKLIGYILPAVLPLVFLLADGMRLALAGRSHGPIVERWLLAAAGLLCVGAVVAVGVYGNQSAKPIANNVGAPLSPTDRVLMLDSYVFDAPFYLRLSQPAWLAAAWSAPEIKARDGWRRELVDAREFAPEGAATRMIELDQVGSVLCRPGTTWIFADPDAARRFPWLKRAEVAASASRFRVWRWRTGADTAGSECRL